MSYNTIADKLQDLIDAKADRKSAIKEKGVEVTGGLVTYADAINSIDNGTEIYYTFPTGTKFSRSTINLIPKCMVDHINTCTNLTMMFAYCDHLITVPKLDTSNATTVSAMFRSCSYVSCSLYDYPDRYIHKIALLDFGNVHNMDFLFYNTYGPTILGGFKDLGKQADLFGNPYLYCLNLNRTSYLNVFNNLYDRASAGYSAIKLGINENAVNILSDEDIAIATNKGWIIYYD